MPALRPITSVAAGLAHDEWYPLSSSDKEALAVFVVQSGTNRDRTYPSNRFTRLGALTSGTRTGGGAQIRGGSI